MRYDKDEVENGVTHSNTKENIQFIVQMYIKTKQKQFCPN